ncbi:hypothetical protein ABZ354_17260 [Streptomyces sp. NPDC005925]|uniref:phthiocerol/phthiodiolone dimycocerosyl transferase family protein n=1 Tax=Streptomyces sp. NPDC005925 TaxID=3157172 RepID=UPI0033D57F2E
MTTAGIRRALTPTEEIYAAVEMYVGYTVRTVGRLDPEALRAAYQAVCRTYPQLASRLEHGEEGPVLVECETCPDVQFSDGDLERPLVCAELDQHRSLSALDVVRDGDGASVTLVTHHSIADAPQSLAVLADLWSRYTDAVRGVPVETPRRPYPRPLEDLLAERGIHGVSSAGEGDSRPSPGKVGQANGYAWPTLVRHVAQCRLTATETTALSELCHREHVTIHGLLSGVILLVEAETRDLPLTDLVYRYTVDLRGRLTPRVGPAEGTNVLGGVVFRADDGIAPDAVTLGRAIGEQLRAGLADGSVQRSLLDMVAHHQRADAAPAPQPPPGRAVVSMTNWGVVPPLRTPDDLRATNFHSSSRRRVAPGDSAGVGGYVVTTFGGRLGIDLAWPTRDAEQSRRLDCLRERLHRMLRS